MYRSANIFRSLPTDLTEEVFEDLIRSTSVRIERIISKGHTSRDWYDQEENEWIVVLKGRATLLFKDGATLELGVGDYFNIPAGLPHKVSWTDPETETIWLAVFYR